MKLDSLLKESKKLIENNDDKSTQNIHYSLGLIRWADCKLNKGALYKLLDFYEEVNDEINRMNRLNNKSSDELTENLRENLFYKKLFEAGLNGLVKEMPRDNVYVIKCFDNHNPVLISKTLRIYEINSIVCDEYIFTTPYPKEYYNKKNINLRRGSYNIEGAGRINKNELIKIINDELKAGPRVKFSEVIDTFIRIIP